MKILNILAMDEDGNTLIHLHGRGPVIDGLLHEAQLQGDDTTRNNSLNHALKAFWGD